MISAIIGQKQMQMQQFLSDGTRIPVTKVHVPSFSVVRVKMQEKDGYTAILLGLGSKKHPHKAMQGILRGAKIQTAPRFLREVRIDHSVDTLPQAGDVLKASDVLKPGDIVDVIGVSKGKGYAGVVKRHHFKGGPRTHGQSDRERAPGSIGQTTTPGRVYKGKRMAGRMGGERVTVKNLTVVDVLNDAVLLKGLIPGSAHSLVVIKKKGESKKFTPLFKEKVEEVEKVEDKKEESKENAS